MNGLRLIEWLRFTAIIKKNSNFSSLSKGLSKKLMWENHLEIMRVLVDLFVKTQ